MRAVSIYGAKTLERFTNNILVKGFESIEWKVTVPPTSLLASSSNAQLFQLHGAPQSEEEDKALVVLLRSRVAATPAANSTIVILIHRPDELQMRHPSFSDVLDSASPSAPLHLVFLGDKHLTDSFYSKGAHVKRHVIPHCFFDLTPRFLDDCIAIGTFTTWGEMRTVEHLVKLLLVVFELRKEHQIDLPVIGYLGGKPANELALERIRQLCTSLAPTLPVSVVDVSDYDPKQISTLHANTILVDTGSVEKLTPHFNTQLYHLGTKIRTGESSGSVHACAGVPVIWEMNGSEKIEDLAVVRIPYHSLETVESVDYRTGAISILQAIQSGSVARMVAHNLAQAKTFNCTFSATKYAEIFLSSHVNK